MSLVIVPHEPAVWYMETPATLSFSIIPAPLRTFPPILGGIATIKVPPSKLWTPDHFYNINNRGGCHFAPIVSNFFYYISLNLFQVILMVIKKLEIYSLVSRPNM